MRPHKATLRTNTGSGSRLKNTKYDRAYVRKKGRRKRKMRACVTVATNERGVVTGRKGAMPVARRSLVMSSWSYSLKEGLTPITKLTIFFHLGSEEQESCSICVWCSTVAWRRLQLKVWTLRRTSSGKKDKLSEI